MRHGFLLIHKPEGPTSHDVVAKVRRVLPEKKIGHLGTLDPAASGLLVLAVGSKALKVVELFAKLTKEYIADVHFGAVSTTYDREGTLEEVVRKPGVEEPTDSEIQNIIADRFAGEIEQVPPGYSAVKVGGERAYRKMRQGRLVELPPRKVEITECDMLSYVYPDLKLRVACSSGTYIRSLAHDIGDLLRVGGYLAALQRTRVGEWSLEDAVEPDGAAWSRVLPLKEVLARFPKIELSDAEADAIIKGQSIFRNVRNDTIAWHNGLPIAILTALSAEETRARKVL